MTNEPSRPIPVFVVGTRAQLIKVAPVVVACEAAGRPAILLFTGQHKETMADLVEEFGIRSPREQLTDVSERATIGALLRWLPSAYSSLVRRLRAFAADGLVPRVVVHGDTLSTVLGAVAAKWAHAQVYHLESGLTSGRLFDPFPEELSRRIVFRMTDVALCPNPASAAYMRANHRAEVIDTGGNTIEDAVAIAMREAPAAGVVGDYVVASLHRFQNLFDRSRLRALVTMLLDLSSHVPVHFVLHPATRKRLESEGLMARLSGSGRVLLVPRLGYRRFLHLASGARAVLTDGGSNQEELAALGVPTIIMRRQTERPDGLGANAVMEADLPQGLVAAYLAGDIERLRRTPRQLDSAGPSQRVAEALAR